MIHLRDYQQKAIEDLRTSLKDYNSILLRSPTGSGKTAITAYMFSRAALKQKCWFVVHKRELVAQASETFKQFNIPHGIIAAGQPEQPQHNMQICMVQTLSRRLKRLARPRFIVWDEAAHAASRTWRHIHSQFPDIKHIGLSAVSERLDGKPLSDIFQYMVEGPEIRWLMDNGYLSDYKLYAPVSISMKGARTKFGEYNHQDVEAILDKSTIVGDAILHYKQMANGRPGLIFCHSIKHSKIITEAFNEAGIKTAHIDGIMPTSERDEKVAAFRNKEITLLSSVEILIEGFDVPGAEVCLMLRPTQSLSLYLQMVGRVLRPAFEKTHAILIDAVGNSMRHDLPCIEREWSLEGRKKRKRGADDTIPANLNFRICPKCYASNPLAATVCQECKAELPRQEREIKQVEGELGEVDKAARKISPERLEVARAQTFEELEKIRIARNYRPGWSYFMMQARGKRRKVRNG